MSWTVLLIVLASAALHAGWNALVRGAGDRLQSMQLVVMGAGVLALPVIVWLPAPAAASWPWLLASALIHVLYFSLVGLAYRHADLSLAYPVMRGTAPALTALGALLWLGELPAMGVWLGVGLIVGGALLLALAVPRTAGGHRRGLALALGNACVIAVYSVIDGQGTRLSGQPLAYTATMFALTALGTAVLWIAPRQRASLRLDARGALLTLGGGGATLAAYSLVLWAMTQAPIASVAALRETSIVFAALLGWGLLGERIARLRWLSIALICLGAVAIKLG